MKMVIGNKLARQDKNERMKTACLVDELNGGKNKNLFPGLKEIKSKRGKRSKYFSVENKKMLAEFYDRPVHYYDCESGAYQEIDTRFNDNGTTIETRKNSFKSRFNKHMANGKIFEMEKDLCKVGLSSLDVAKSEKCNMEVYEDDIENSGKVLIKDVSDNTDIEYCITADRIKENIIVKNRADKYEYNFDLSIDNIAIDVSDDGKSLELIEKHVGKVEFYIPSPIMFDAAGKQSESVYYEIEQENSDFIKIKVVADPDWINDSNRKFPVTIDPQIVTANFTGSYYNTDDYEDSIFQYEVFENGVKKGGGDLRLYYNDTTKKEIHTEIIILKNQLPSYIRNNFTSIKLKLRAAPNSTVIGFSVGYQSFYGNEGTQFEADVTHFFYSDNEIRIPLSNCFYRGSCNENDIHFLPPTLLIEYKLRMVGMSITKEPDKTSYIPGEKFSPEGMIVQGVYEDGRTEPIANAALKFEPSGTLTTYDQSVRVIYKNEDEDEYVECLQPINMAEGDYWFNDRRSAENMENVYTATLVGANGQLSNQSYIVRLEHADGIEAGSEREGTPLNAQTFNKIVKVLKEKGILE